MTRPQPDCRDLLLRLSAYLDGDLPPREGHRVLRHLRRCACCEAVFAGLQRTTALCRDAAPRRLPPAVRSRARARIARLLGKRSKSA